MVETDIGSSLELEGKKIQEYAKRFDEIASDVKILAEKKAYMKDFAILTNNLNTCIQETLHKRIKNLLMLKDSVPELPAKKLSDLKALLRKIHYIIRTQYLNHDKIPRNLYRLIDYFLERCNIEISYIISFGESLSVNPFNQLLRYYAAKSIYPELFDKIEKDYEHIYFIYIPPEFSEEKKALVWPAIIHEAVHAIDQKENIVHKFFPDVEKWLMDIRKGAIEANDPYCIQKLWAMEYVADYLSTWAIGPFFPKILMEEYFTIGSLLKPQKTHPRLDMRVEKLLGLLEKGEFKHEREMLRKKLKHQCIGYSKKTPNDKIKELDDIFKTVEEKFKCAQFSLKEYEKSLKESLPGFEKEQLVKDFEDLKPVLINPFSLLTLLTTIDNIEKNEKLNVLFSDCIKLYMIKNEFEEKCCNS